jgi:hypothetical protein
MSVANALCIQSPSLEMTDASVGRGELVHTAPIGEQRDIARIRRVYRTTFAASVCLAAIGAPIFMQGTVALALGIAHPEPSHGSLIRGVLLFGLSLIPIALAAVAWKLTQTYQQTLDKEP